MCLCVCVRLCVCVCVFMLEFVCKRVCVSLSMYLESGIAGDGSLSSTSRSGSFSLGPKSPS